jgi:hypothetical protein
MGGVERRQVLNAGSGGDRLSTRLPCDTYGISRSCCGRWPDVGRLARLRANCELLPVANAA